MTIRTKIQLGAILILAVFALILLLSQTATLDNPVRFSFKRIQEKAYLNLKSNPQEQLDYMSFLLDRRLEELGNQVRRQSYSHILPSATRYSTLAGQITDLLVTNNLEDKIEGIKQQFLDHQKVLQDIYVMYPKNTDNVEYKYIEDDINYLKIYLDKLTNFFNAEKA